MPVRSLTIACLAGAVFLAGTASVGAQGRGHHGPPPVNERGNSGSSTSTTTTGTSRGVSTRPTAQTEIQAATSGRQQTFGSWLDTADVNAPGEAWLSASTTYWRSSSLREVDAPSVGMSVGVAPRMQIGVSLPYYHVTDPSGFTSHGFGASYVTAKIALTSDRRVDAAISPTAEILSWSFTDAGVKHVNWVLPISAQGEVGNVRVYGTTGYFSRGSVFGSGAAEWSAGRIVTLAATIAHSYSIASDPVSDALGITRHRTAASGGLYVRASPTVSLFADLGRTFAPVNETSSRVALTGGIAVNVAGPASRAPRLP